jgi:His-Xaa-Ser system radical SAM maturase HxsB
MNNRYHLLPFNFSNFNEDEILINQFGDFIIEEKGTAKSIVEKKLDIDSSLYKDLVAKFFITKNLNFNLLDIYAARYRTKKSFLEEFTALHIIVMTLRCNQGCKYCQVSSIENTNSNFDISNSDLKESINKIFKSPSQYITIEFQGGEPLLVFDKIKFAVEHAEELNLTHKKQIRYVICSNAISLSNNILDYMKQKNICLSTSLDGPKDIHNSNRKFVSKDSHSLTISGIKLAQYKLGADNVSALMTTTSHSLSNPESIVDEYINHGFTSIFFREINPFGYARKPDFANYTTEDFIRFYKKGFEYIIKLNKQGLFFIEDYAAIILKKILTPFSTGFVDLQSPAGIINSTIVYNYDGYIYASDESRMLAENNDYTFQLGKITDSYEDIFFNDKVKEIAKHWNNECIAGCSDCAYQIYCGADPVRNYISTGDLEGFRPNSEFCKKNRAIIELLITKSLEPDNFKIFQKWVNV